MPHFAGGRPFAAGGGGGPSYVQSFGKGFRGGLVGTLAGGANAAVGEARRELRRAEKEAKTAARAVERPIVGTARDVGRIARDFYQGAKPHFVGLGREQARGSTFAPDRAY